MSESRLRPVRVARVIADICGDCRSPCAWQSDAVAHADACRACPIGEWSRWGACPEGAPVLAGDALADLIERRVLTPAAAHVPALVEAVARCGGCGHARHALGSTAAHPDPGVVV